MDRGFLKVTAVGEGSRGTTALSTLYFPTDPAYRSLSLLTTIPLR